ncbi:MAG: OmpA family protein [Saprospiraceae bacterium]
MVFAHKFSPEINSEYNEINPCLTEDGFTLFFSSDNLKSMGGYDIFYSTYDKYNHKWRNISNIGQPGNSSGNETDFRLLNSNLAAVYCSDRPDMGYGEKDIYWLYFKNQINVDYSNLTEIPFIHNMELKQTDIKQTDSTLATDKSDSNNKNPISPSETNNYDNSIFKNNESINELFIPGIFFVDDEFMNNDSLIIFLNKLAIYLKSNPNVNIEIVGNALNFENENDDIYNSVKMAQRVADSLQIRMIKPDRIMVKGYGNNFPLAKKDSPERSKNIVLKLNNRIDIYLHNYDASSNIKKEDIYVLNTIFDSKHDLYESIIDGLSYKVKFKDSYFLVIDNLLNNFNDSGIEYDPEKKIFTYTVGIYKKYSNAKELFSKLLSMNYQDAKIIPYINGVQVSNKDLIFYAKKYNDIINYLEENKIE